MVTSKLTPPPFEGQEGSLELFDKYKIDLNDIPAQLPDIKTLTERICFRRMVFIFLLQFQKIYAKEQKAVMAQNFSSFFI